jgi:hypothetical protein
MVIAEGQLPGRPAVMIWLKSIRIGAPTTIGRDFSSGNPPSIVLYLDSKSKG